jgi:hypothetical protein
MKIALIFLFTVCVAVNAEQAEVNVFTSLLLKRANAPKGQSGGFFSKLIASKGGSNKEEAPAKPAAKTCTPPSPEEMQKAKPEERMGKQWEYTLCEVDTSGDGKISMAEFEAAAKKNGQKDPPPQAMIDNLKKHMGADGKLDKAEFIKMMKEMMAAHARQAPPPPPAPAPPAAAISHSKKQHLRQNKKN